MLPVKMPSVINLFVIKLSALVQSVIILNVVMPIAVMISVVMPTLIKLSAIILNVVMLNVVAPFRVCL
jgi:hypothetical protein